MAVFENKALQNQPDCLTNNQSSDLPRDIERALRDQGSETGGLDRDLHPEAIERNWNQLMALYQERDQMIQEEIARLEKLQRLAEKVRGGGGGIKLVT